jgi:hypothetical protein
MAMVFTDAKEPYNPIIFANDSFLSLSGHNREEVLGQSFDFLMARGANPEALADEAAPCHAQACLDRIKPVVEKLLIGDIARRLRGICFHGVISIGAQTPIRFVETMRRLRHLQIPTTSATAPARCG